MTQDNRDPKMTALLSGWQAPHPSEDAVAAILRRAQMTPQHIAPGGRQRRFAIAASLALLAVGIGASLRFAGAPHLPDATAYAASEGLDENALGLVYSDESMLGSSLETL
jgi:hypothetical protein